MAQVLGELTMDVATDRVAAEVRVEHQPGDRGARWRGGVARVLRFGSARAGERDAQQRHREATGGHVAKDTRRGHQG